MRKIILMSLLAAVCMTVLYQADWKNYEYDSHQLKIAFLQKPDFSMDTSDFNDSPLITNFWELNVDDPLHDNIYYCVSQIAYPPEFIHSDSVFSVVDGFITSTQNSLIGDENFTLLTSTLAEKHGYPGKVF